MPTPTGGQPPEVPTAGRTGADAHPLDRWILGQLDDLVETVTASLEEFDALAGASRLAAFVDDLSNWYVRRSRPRFWHSEDGPPTPRCTSAW